MITESSITLYSKGFDKTTRTDKWFRVQIKDVHWEGNKGINVEKTGLENADSVKVFIPFSSLTEIKDLYIQPGDYIVKGLIDDEISSTSELEKKYKTAVKVKYADVRDDAINKELWHIEVGCE